MGCLDIIIENCDVACLVNKAECNPLTFSTGLTGVFQLNIIDKFNKLYTQPVAVNDTFTIDETLLPLGFFNRYAGAFEINLTNASGFIVPLTINGKNYSQLLLNII